MNISPNRARLSIRRSDPSHTTRMRDMGSMSKKRPPSVPIELLQLLQLLHGLYFNFQSLIPATTQYGVCIVKKTRYPWNTVFSYTKG